MENVKIRTEEDFNNKLSEIANIFGFRFEKDEYGYCINTKNKKLRMTRDNGYYYVTNGNQKICFKSLFAPHMFSTSALIEIYISNGENRILCTFQQELRPGCGSDEMPAFTYAEYVDGKTYIFDSNMHQVETIESNTLTNLMLYKMIEYGDLKSSESTKQTDKKTIESKALDNPMFNKMIEYRDLKMSGSTKQNNKKLIRFLFGIYFGAYDIYLGAHNVAPAVHLDIINNMKGNSFNLWKDTGTLIYNEIKKKYKQDTKMHYDYLPFFKTIQSKSVKQIISDFDYDEKTLEEFQNYMISIVKNPEAVRSFNNTIRYFQNSLAWPYISKYYSSQINYIRKIQNGEVEYICEPRNSKPINQSQVKLLQKKHNLI